MLVGEERQCSCAYFGNLVNVCVSISGRNVSQWKSAV